MEISESELKYIIKKALETANNKKVADAPPPEPTPTPEPTPKKELNKKPVASRPEQPEKPSDLVHEASSQISKIQSDPSIDRHEAASKIHEVIRGANPVDYKHIATHLGVKSTDHLDAARELADRREEHNPELHPHNKTHTAESAADLLRGIIGKGGKHSVEEMAHGSHVLANLDPQHHEKLAQMLGKKPEDIANAAKTSQEYVSQHRKNKSGQYYKDIAESAEKLSSPSMIEINDSKLPGKKVGQFGVVEKPEGNGFAVTHNGRELTNVPDEKSGLEYAGMLHHHGVDPSDEKKVKLFNDYHMNREQPDMTGFKWNPEPQSSLQNNEKQPESDMSGEEVLKGKDTSIPYEESAQTSTNPEVMDNQVDVSEPEQNVQDRTKEKIATEKSSSPSNGTKPLQEEISGSDLDQSREDKPAQDLFDPKYQEPEDSGKQKEIKVDYEGPIGRWLTPDEFKYFSATGDTPFFVKDENGKIIDHAYDENFAKQQSIENSGSYGFIGGPDEFTAQKNNKNSTPKANEQSIQENAEVPESKPEVVEKPVQTTKTSTSNDKKFKKLNARKRKIEKEIAIGEKHGEDVSDLEEQFKDVVIQMGELAKGSEKPVEESIQETAKVPEIKEEVAKESIPENKEESQAKEHEIVKKEPWQMTKEEAESSGFKDNWSSIVDRAIKRGDPVPDEVKKQFDKHIEDYDKKTKKPDAPAPKIGDKIIRYIHKDGTGLMNNSGIDRSKLTDEEEEELIDLMDLGLRQPPQGTSGSFYFTKEGDRKHKRLIELLSKASKTGILRTEDKIPHTPDWVSDDGQVAIRPAATEKSNKPEISPSPSQPKQLSDRERLQAKLGKTIDKTKVDQGASVGKEDVPDAPKEEPNKEQNPVINKPTEEEKDYSDITDNVKEIHTKLKSGGLDQYLSSLDDEKRQKIADFMDNPAARNKTIMINGKISTIGKLAEKIRGARLDKIEKTPEELERLERDKKEAEVNRERIKEVKPIISSKQQPERVVEAQKELDQVNQQLKDFNPDDYEDLGWARGAKQKLKDKKDNLEAVISKYREAAISSDDADESDVELARSYLGPTPELDEDDDQESGSLKLRESAKEVLEAGVNFNDKISSLKKEQSKELKKAIKDGNVDEFLDSVPDEDKESVSEIIKLHNIFEDKKEKHQNALEKHHEEVYGIESGPNSSDKGTSRAGVPYEILPTGDGKYVVSLHENAEKKGGKVFAKLEDAKKRAEEAVFKRGYSAEGKTKARQYKTDGKDPLTDDDLKQIVRVNEEYGFDEDSEIDMEEASKHENLDKYNEFKKQTDSKRKELQKIDKKVYGDDYDKLVDLQSDYQKYHDDYSEAVEIQDIDNQIEDIDAEVIDLEDLASGIETDLKSGNLSAKAQKNLIQERLQVAAKIEKLKQEKKEKKKDSGKLLKKHKAALEAFPEIEKQIKELADKHPRSEESKAEAKVIGDELSKIARKLTNASRFLATKYPKKD